MKISKLFGWIVAMITFIGGVSSLEFDVYRRRHIPTSAENWDAASVNDSVVLYKYLNSEYYSLIGVGSPAKEFKVTFNTAWGDSWLPSQHCGVLEIPCLIHTRYDSSKSSTYQEDGRPFNRSGPAVSLSGFLSVDDFHLPHLKVRNQTFVEITKMSRIPFAFNRADGIIGLGFDSLAVSGTTGFFYNLVKQELIKQQVFTFYMNRDPTTEKAGKIIFGATERSHAKGNLTLLSVTEKKYWTVKMERVVVDQNKKSHAFCMNGCNVTFDTSSNEISGPAGDIEKINNLLHAKEISPTWPYRYVVDCRNFAKLAHVSFVFDGQEFTIESKYYIQHMTFHPFTLCLSPFTVSDDNSWTLGGAFLMQFYTEFDVGEGEVRIAETVF